MSNIDAVNAYVAGWNARDADAVLAALTEDGTYQDPITGGPIGGAAFREYMAGLWDAFPDLSFELVSVAETGTNSAAFQWIMRGTNSGSMSGLPPTGKTVVVSGADFVTVKDGRIETVNGYFDSAAVPRQVGLDVIVQPAEIGPFKFGTALCVQTGKMQAPEAFSITHLEAIDDAAVEKVREGGRASLIDMLKMDGFIGSMTAIVGHRMVTVTAWDDVDAPRKVMSEGAHAQVMKGMIDGMLAKGGFTSVYTKARVNRYLLRCEACGKMHREPEEGASCSCGAILPERFPYW